MTSILTWIAAVWYIHRSQQILFGMDTMMNILIFYLMIGNCGATLSVDRLTSPAIGPPGPKSAPVAWKNR